jgi:acetolactate synthase-1/2/3 large subunit
LREGALLPAARIAAKTGVKLYAETFPTRMERGAGLPAVERIAYLAELAGVQLKDLDHLILVDAKAPVSFFAYPGKKSYLVPDTCAVHTLSTPEQDAVGSLQKLAARWVPSKAPLHWPPRSAPAARAATSSRAQKVCKAVGHLLPANAIIVDESITSGLMLPKFTAGRRAMT